MITFFIKALLSPVVLCIIVDQRKHKHTATTVTIHKRVQVVLYRFVYFGVHELAMLYSRSQ